jgi:hypothetical protein
MLGLPSSTLEVSSSWMISRLLLAIDANFSSYQQFQEFGEL